MCVCVSSPFSNPLTHYSNVADFATNSFIFTTTRSAPHTQTHTPSFFPPPPQALIARHQNTLAQQDATLAAAREDCVSLQTRVAAAQSARDIALAGEAAMAKSLREVTEERDRAQRTAESLATIEAGLSAREAAAGEAAVEAAVEAAAGEAISGQRWPPPTQEAPLCMRRPRSGES